MVPAHVLAARLAADPSSPLVTFYDDAEGIRIELSAATLANAVAKTAGLLIDGLGLLPGDEVGVALPLHWRTPVALLACWSAGCPPVLGSTEGAAAFVTRDDVESAGAGEIIAVGLDAFGRPLTGLPVGVNDLADAASYADTFTPTAPLSVDDGPAVPDGARVLTVREYDDGAAIWLGLLGPLAAGGSVVAVAHADAAALAERCTTERVTHTYGIDVDGLPRLA
ncbi:MAG TPA: TIGR03089 family protein [Mycobacteriales bacterium]|nr:TIGR03089 family protein [Mycobacteriales bacterium]